MKKSILRGITIPLLFVLLFGCSSIENKLTEEEAKTIALNTISENNGKPKVTKVEIKNNNYVVHWEKEAHYEKGSVTINKKGKVKEQMHSIE